MREVGIASGWGLYASSGVKKPPILLNGDLGCSYRKGIQPDAMNRAFHRLTGLDPMENQPAAMRIRIGSLISERRPLES